MAEDTIRENSENQHQIPLKNITNSEPNAVLSTEFINNNADGVLSITKGVTATKDLNNDIVSDIADDKSDDESDDVEEEDTNCGMAGYHPKWLQIFASKKTYMVMYSLLGLYEATLGAYYTGTISTIEKRFKLPSTISGIISGAWDVGSMCAALVIAYYGSAGNKTKWVSIGVLLVGASCFLRHLPHVIYGPGEEAILYSSNRSIDSLCLNDNTPVENCSLNFEGTITFFILVTSQLILGIGASPYYTLGAAYLDDNVQKNKFPFLLGLAAAFYYLGPSLGYAISSYTLSIFVNPSGNPSFGQDDPRWIGAWYLAWVPLGYCGFVVAFLMVLFPKILPREAERRRNKSATKKLLVKSEDRSLSDFKITLLRLVKNPLLMLNSLGLTFYIFGIVGFWIFLPKYFEAQFRKTATEANLITGAVGLVCAALGLISSGIIISKFKPRATVLAAWNIFADGFEVIAYVVFAYLGCFKDDLEGYQNPDGSWNTIAECNAGCNCTAGITYSPVCSMDGSKTFFSPCHAGCTTMDLQNDTKIFTNCSCITNGLQQAMDGACPSDCSKVFLTFLILLCVTEFLSATGRAGNSLIQLRAVHVDDKSVSIALNEVLVCAFALIPGPIFYGMLLDSSCSVWGMVCGQTGNCLLYNGDKMRFLLNYAAAGFVLIALLFDIGVLLKVGNLKLYDDDESETGEVDADDKKMTETVSEHHSSDDTEKLKKQK